MSKQAREAILAKINKMAAEQKKFEQKLQVAEEYERPIFEVAIFMLKEQITSLHIELTDQ